jgi:hypothetical protein
MSVWSRLRRTPAWWVPVVLVAVVGAAVLVQVLLRDSGQPAPSATSSSPSSATSTAGHSFRSVPESFEQQLRAGRVKSVVIDEVSQTIDVTAKGPVVERYSVEYPSLDELMALLTERSGVVVTFYKPPWWADLLLMGLIFLIVATAGGVLGYVLGRRRGRRDAARAAAPVSEET